MLTKEQIKKVFRKICDSYANFDEALDAYDAYLEHKAEEQCIVVGSDEYAELFKNDEKEAIPWVIEGLVNDKVVDYINKNMKYIPIIEFPKDKALSEINYGIKKTKYFLKSVGASTEFLYPYIFDVKACRVGSTGFDSGGNHEDFNYSVGDFVTYILSDGTYCVVEEKCYGYDDFSDCVIRRIVNDGCPLLNELDDLFDEDYQGLFDV